MSTGDFSASSRGLVRWRTALWSAVAATPLVAGALAIVVRQLEDGEPHRPTKVAVVIGAVALSNVVAWRAPRAPGVALGVAAPLLAVGLFWVVSLGVAGQRVEWRRPRPAKTRRRALGLRLRRLCRGVDSYRADLRDQCLRA